MTVGTVFESSKVGLNKWLYVNHVLCSSKKGTSAHQIARNIGVSYKTAWFMMHRIREAMKEIDSGPMGGFGKIIEADETYVGGKARTARPASSVSASARPRPSTTSSPSFPLSSAAARSAASMLPRSLAKPCVPSSLPTSTVTAGS